MLCVEEIRKDFPIVSSKIDEKPLIYLDNAATTQLPEPVLRMMVEHYHHHHSNVHRGIHTLSERSTAHMEQAREQLQRFLGAAHSEEVIFTSGTTGAINLVARSMSFGILQPGDEVITTQMEHHANLIPWQEACRRSGATLKVIPVTPTGELDMEAYAAALSTRTKLVAVTWVSNVTGAVNPIREIIAQAHQYGAWVLVDGAQAIRHCPLDVKELDCDFFCLSGHKMMGPTGTGILYGKRTILEQLTPETFGGGMVDLVTDQSASYGDLPFRLEAGTPNIAGNIGLGSVAKYLMEHDMTKIADYEEGLLKKLESELRKRPQVQILGMPEKRCGCLSFNLQGGHCYDVARLLDQLGIAVRSGTHCAQPLLTAMGVSGTVRVSPAFYNTREEIDQFLCAIDRIIRVLERKARR